MIIIPDTLLLVPLKCSGVFWVMASYSCLSLKDLRASPVAQIVKNLPAMLRPGFDPWVGILWRKEWLPTPVVLLGEFHGQRSLGSTVHEVTKKKSRCVL